MFGASPYGAVPFASLSSPPIYTSYIVEAASGGDTFDFIFPIVTSVSETSSASGVITGLAGFSCNVLDTTSAAVVVYAGDSNTQSVVESATATDQAVNANPLWSDINAEQTPNWTDIQAI